MTVRTFVPRHVAVHEAAHAVAEWGFSHGFLTVCVRSRAEVAADPVPGRHSDGARLRGLCQPRVSLSAEFIDRHGHLLFVPEAHRAAVRDQLAVEAVVLLAGPHATAKQARRGLADALLRGGAADMREANHIARFLTACDEERQAFLDEAEQAAQRFLRDPAVWHAVQGMADLLVVHGAVDEAMAEHALAALPRWAP